MKKLIYIVFLLLPPFVFGQNLTLQDSLIAYYPFNGNAQDESSHSNHGIVSGATLVADRFGNPNSAYSFDGINDEINVVSPFGGQAVIGTKFTMAGWVKTTTSKIGGAVISIHTACIGSSSDDYFIAYISNLNHPDFAYHHFITGLYYHLPFAMVDESTITDGSWHFFSYTYDDGFATVKIDNQLLYASQVTPKNYIHNPSNNLVIGNAHQSNCADDLFFEGDIDDLRLYNRVLSDSEIQMLYTNNTNTGELLNENSFNIFPNPTSSLLNIRFEMNDASVQTYEIELVNTLGQIVSKQIIDDTSSILNMEIDVSEHSAGMYWVRLNAVYDGKIIDTAAKKVVIQ